MNNNTGDLKKHLDHFEEVLKTEGIKLTHQRLEIFKEVVSTEDHPDAESVYRRVRKHLPSISQDTVYRTLWLLKDLGLITTLGSPRERTRFDGNLDRHHHFTCIKCAFTRDFYSEELNNLKLPEQVDALGHMDTTRVEVRGVCHNCAEK